MNSVSFAFMSKPILHAIHEGFGLGRYIFFKNFKLLENLQKKSNVSENVYKWGEHGFASMCLIQKGSPWSGNTMTLG